MGRGSQGGALVWGNDAGVVSKQGNDTGRVGRHTKIKWWNQSAGRQPRHWKARQSN